MNKHRITKNTTAIAAALTTSLFAGCGIFGSSGINRYEVNDPNRMAARVTANVATTTLYTAEHPADSSVFSAILYDADGRQFYGPEVLLDGEAVPSVAAAGNNPSRYQKTGLAFSTGATHTVSIQGHTGATPPALPAIQVTAPPRATGTDNKGEPVTLNFFAQPAHQGATIEWTGGDPGRPVYIVVWGDPTSESGRNQRRLYVRDNPAQSPTDPDNYGLPITNTGRYDVPAEITERIVSADGKVTTRIVPTFDNPARKGDARRFFIYVVQRTDTAREGPLELTSLSLATAVAGVSPRKD